MRIEGQYRRLQTFFSRAARATSRNNSWCPVWTPSKLPMVTRHRLKCGGFL